MDKTHPMDLYETGDEYPAFDDEATFLDCKVKKYINI